MRDYLIVKVLSEAAFKYKDNGAKNIEIGSSMHGQVINRKRWVDINSNLSRE